MTILEELYMGNIAFDSGRYPPDSPFVKAARKKVECMEKLTATLNDAERELFEQYIEAQGDIEDITRYDTYASALKFGVRLIAEICMDEKREQMYQA